MMQIAMTALALGTLATAPPTKPVVTQLDNGVRLVAISVPETDQIAIEVFFDIGMADDPAGMPHAAHLLEHIVCRGATDTHEAGQVWDELSTIGMINAETMGSTTHYDLIIPADRLDWALDLTAQWVGSLRIDEAIIEQEMPRCAQEVRFLESNRPSALGKFAFMAANQVWRHGATEVAIKTRAAAMTPKALTRLHDRAITPAGLTIVIVGDFVHDDLLAHARATLGRLPAHDQPALVPINLGTLPAEIEAPWDVTSDAVIVAFPAPADPFERAVLTSWSLMAQMQLGLNPRLKAVTTLALAGGRSFPVGKMPMMVVAIPSEGIRAEDLARVLREELLILASPDRRAGQASVVRAIAAGTLKPPRPTLRRIKRMAKQLAGGADDVSAHRRAMGMALLQTALEHGLAETTTHDWTDAVRDRLGALDETTLSEILERTVQPGLARVLILRSTSADP